MYYEKIRVNRDWLHCWNFFDVRQLGSRRSTEEVLHRRVKNWTSIRTKPVDKATHDTCKVELNGKVLSIAAILKDDKSFIPVRKFAELLGRESEVGWNDQLKKVTMCEKC